MLLEPYVRDLAAMLTTCIDEAIRRNEISRPEEILAAQHQSDPGAVNSVPVRDLSFVRQGIGSNARTSLWGRNCALYGRT